MAEEADFLFIVYLVAGFALDGWSFPISLIKLTFVIEDHVRALKNFIKFFLEVFRIGYFNECFGPCGFLISFVYKEACRVVHIFSVFGQIGMRVDSRVSHNGREGNGDIRVLERACGVCSFNLYDLQILWIFGNIQNGIVVPALLAELNETELLHEQERTVHI